MRQILSEAQAAVLADERRALMALQTALVRAEAAPEDLKILQESILQMEGLFLLVVVGEFNAGKSTFLNALLGRRLLAEGVTPTTRRIHVLGWGASERRELLASDIELIEAPVEMLREVRLVDTPGTNALERRHEAITREFTPRSDLVLFVTSADRPFTESERLFLQSIRAWGKKIVFTINKIDILKSPDEVAEIVEFVRDNAHRLLDLEPKIFAVSASRAIAAKIDGGGRELLEASGFPALEAHLQDTLESVERVRLKLLNPLGVGDELASRYLGAIREREALLAADRAALEEIDRQLSLYREDMEREFRFRLSDIDNLLHEFEARGEAFFDETLRLGRVPDLLNKAKLEADFGRRVVADLPRDLETRVGTLIDWMLGAEIRQWQAVSAHLESRRAQHAGRLVGSFASFDHDRGRLLETVGRATRRTFDGYDRETEGRRLAASVQTAVASAALLEVGAIGLGATVAALATTQFADVTGILAAGTLAILGLLVIPARRRRARRQLSAKIHHLRQKLMETLHTQFGQELESSIYRIEEAVTPYSRFVRAELARLIEHREELEGLRRQLDALRAGIQGW